MRTATANDLGGDGGLILRQLRVLEHSHQQEGGLGGRWRARRVRRIRRQLRKLLAP